MRLLLLAAALLIPVSGKTQITGIVTLPGGTTVQAGVQYNDRGRFAAVAGSHVVSTGTVALRELAVQYGVSAATVSVRGALTAGSISGTVSAGSVDLSTVTARFVTVGASTAALTAILTQVGTDTQTLRVGLTSVGASTAALTSILTQVGTDTQTLRVGLTSVGASTAAITSILTTVGASTNTLSISTANLASGGATTYIRVSGGTMTGPLTVQNIIGPTTVTGGTMTVAQAWLGQTSSSAPIFYVGTNGAASAPSIAGPQTNTGILFSGTDMLFAANGTTRGSVVTGTGICGGSGATTGQPCLRSSVGDKTDATFQWAGDPNTGFFRSAADEQRLVAGGVEGMKEDASGVYMMPFTNGTSTFSATGLSIGGANGYIITQSSIQGSAFFGDGSHLSGLSGASVSANNTWTGTNSFGSSNTINGLETVNASFTMAAGSTMTIAESTTISGSSITVNNPVNCTGMYCVIASSSPADGTKQINFLGLAASTYYMIEISAAQTSAQGALQMQFNGDSGSNYKWSAHQTWQDPNDTYQGGNNVGVCQIGPTNYTNGVIVNDAVMMTIKFRTNPINSNAVRAHWQGSQYGNFSSASEFSFFGGCRYNGSASLTSVQISVNAGLFRGNVTLLRLKSAN